MMAAISAKIGAACGSESLLAETTAPPTPTKVNSLDRPPSSVMKRILVSSSRLKKGLGQASLRTNSLDDRGKIGCLPSSVDWKVNPFPSSTIAAKLSGDNRYTPT